MLLFQYVLLFCLSLQLGAKAQLPKQKATKVVAGKGGGSRGGQRR